MTLTDARDTYNFRAGTPVELLSNGQWRAIRGWRRLELWLLGRWRRATRWFRPRMVVKRVDVAAGKVTLVQERWSWRRWRWEE